MYAKEIIHAIGVHHIYEYCVVGDDFRVIGYSDTLSKYCDFSACSLQNVDLFCLVPELVGMEETLRDMFANEDKVLLIPMVFKEPDAYINIHIHREKDSRKLIILFENITEATKAQLYSSQIHKENLLLLKDVAQKNKQLKAFNEEMQTLVDKEVSKNREKQHMLELQTRHAQMGEMISLITHQWKQPLSVIQTLGTRLKMKHNLRTLSSDVIIEKVDSILKQADHMTQTVHDFQTFFTPSKKKALFSVKKTIQTVLDLVKMEYALNNITIVLEGDDDVTTTGYPNEYNQVILSLLQNAKEAFMQHAEHKAEKYVHIRVINEASRALVSICDNAGGIPKEMREEIFTQYSTSKKNGSGLGLYIAKSVIENNMQGRIWAENLVGGTVFFIRV